jgi:hypothetical protein
MNNKCSIKIYLDYNKNISDIVLYDQYESILFKLIRISESDYILSLKHAEENLSLELSEAIELVNRKLVDMLDFSPEQSLVIDFEIIN